jgi:poly-beta-1,6-N-acetyl-D-glucosamine biosynthesis protein PgaD
MYGSIIAGIALLWFCWTLFTSWRKPIVLPVQQAAVDDQNLCETFHISSAQLHQGRLAKVVTVSFDDAGHITGITSA